MLRAAASASLMCERARLDEADSCLRDTAPLVQAQFDTRPATRVRQPAGSGYVVCQDVGSDPAG